MADATKPTNGGLATDQQVRLIGQCHIASALHTILGMDPLIGPEGSKAYIERFLAEAEATTDPVERTMVEQLVLAHHRIATLHVAGIKAASAEESEQYNRAARQLLAEFRRLAEVLHRYRTPAQGRSTTIVHRVEQWNQARGDQEVGYARADGERGEGLRIARDSELTSNTEEVNDDLQALRAQRLQESPAGCRGAEEPAEASGVDGGGA